VIDINWNDVLKLSAPFFTAILMVWIKGWIESRESRRNKQHALSRLLTEGLHESLETVQAFKRIAESAAKGKLRLVSLDVSSLVSKFSCDLADLDSKYAYCYADLASSLEIVNKGIARLSVLVLNRANASTKDISLQLDKAIIGQSKITATDCISMNKAALKVMEAIPHKIRYSSDEQAMDSFQQDINSAEKEMAEWPSIPIQQNTPITSPDSPVV
jgi:hypothetical protein